MAHCKNAIITCVDFRLFNEFVRWMVENGYAGDCDLITRAGASKDIADSSEFQVSLWRDLEVSCDLHKAENVILLHHGDCGAYKKRYSFANAAAEKKKQLEDMFRAKEIIKSRYPSVKVTLVWAELQDPEGKEVIFSFVD